MASTSPSRSELPEAVMEDIAKVVHGYILREFLPGEDPNDLSELTPLITGGILDSISTLKLVVFLEDHFGITVEAHEAGVEHLDSVSQIADLVASKKHAA
jgi:acyl carrier protein